MKDFILFDAENEAEKACLKAYQLLQELTSVVQLVNTTTDEDDVPSTEELNSITMDLYSHVNGDSDVVGTEALEGVKKLLGRIWKALVKAVEALYEHLLKFLEAIGLRSTNSAKVKAKSDVKDAIVTITERPLTPEEKEYVLGKAAKDIDSAANATEAFTASVNAVNDIKKSNEEVKDALKTKAIRDAVKYDPKDAWAGYGDLKDFNAAYKDALTFYNAIKDRPTRFKKALEVAEQFTTIDLDQSMADIKVEVGKLLMDFDALGDGEVIGTRLDLQNKTFKVDIKKTGGDSPIELTGLRRLSRKVKPAKVYVAQEAEDMLKVSENIESLVKRYTEFAVMVKEVSKPMTKSEYNFTSLLGRLNRLISKLKLNKKIVHDLKIVRYVVSNAHKTFGSDASVAADIVKELESLNLAIQSHPKY